MLQLAANTKAATGKVLTAPSTEIYKYLGQRITLERDFDHLIIIDKKILTRNKFTTNKMLY